MDSEAILTEFPEVFKKYKLVIGIGIVGVILFVYGLISLFASSNTSPSKFSQDNSASKAQVFTTPEANTIKIDIEGAVAKPGVYKLDFDSIIQDGLVSAGGLSENADRDYVAKNINLAAKLTDGAKIYIPKIGENISQTVLGAETKNGLININTASEDSLDSLPGIGKVSADKIISGRPYTKVDDLLSKKIITSSVFNKIKDLISAY